MMQIVPAQLLATYLNAHVADSDDKVDWRELMPFPLQKTTAELEGERKLQEFRRLIAMKKIRQQQQQDGLR